MRGSTAMLSLECMQLFQIPQAPMPHPQALTRWESVRVGLRSWCQRPPEGRRGVCGREGEPLERGRNGIWLLGRGGGRQVDEGGGGGGVATVLERVSGRVRSSLIWWVCRLGRESTLWTCPVQLLYIYGVAYIRSVGTMLILTLTTNVFLLSFQPI